MNDHDDPTHRSPPRAEPLQPDRPGRGTDKQKPPSATGHGSSESAEKLKRQSEDAVENVREGYGGS
jgi:hypothetical protein